MTEAHFKDMEAKWQKKWEESKVYKTTEDPNKEKFYILDMFPYPSGAGLHVGHPKGYIATDTLARKKMLEGCSVLHPMGFDTFGLGTEQYAIDHKMKPQVVAKENIENFKRQLASMGFSYDRDRSFSTADPEYYRWTQWIFLQFYTHYYDEEAKTAKPISELEEKLIGTPIMKGGGSQSGSGGPNVEGKIPPTPLYERGSQALTQALDAKRLAYIDFKPINRCPHCMTGLANEDLEDGKCERCGSEVEQRPMRQRVLRITAYADRLLEGLDELDWEESMKELERNWIGKSEGTQFEMKIAIPLMKGEEPQSGSGGSSVEWTSPTSPSEGGSERLSFEVFTTRVDTVFGMSFVVMAPEHTLVDQITTAEYKDAVEAYKNQAKHKTQLERTELQKEKTGQFTGAYAINPFNGEEVPVYIGDYVLVNYGTGVVMAVPAHDERDFEFAKKYDIAIRESVRPLPNPLLEGEGISGEKNESKASYNVDYAQYQDVPSYIKALAKELRKNQTSTEDIMREVLRNRNISQLKFRRQHPFGRYIVDFYCDELKLAIEIDGKIHDQQQEYDQQREEEISSYGVNFLRFSVEEVEEHLEEVVAKIIEYASSPLSLKERGRGWGDTHELSHAFTEKGVVINSAQFSGLTSDEAIKSMQERLQEQGIGGVKANYKIQDRVFSRQRYWGEPFPVVFCNHCGEQELVTPLTKGGGDEGAGGLQNNYSTSPTPPYKGGLYTINFYNQKSRNGILSKKKTIETRALNPEEVDRYFGNIQIGDYLKMVNKETHEVQYARITNAYQWKSFEELYNFEKLEAIYSDDKEFSEVTSADVLKKHWDFTPGYIEKVEKNGMVGREIELVNIAKSIPLSETDLPVELPDVDNYEPTGREEGPLADIDRWMNTPCPTCGGPARRESNTMPGRAGSSRYWLRYMDAHNDQSMLAPDKEKYWGNVDVYVGGAEHVTRHMIYARFWQKFLFDIGVVTKQEPFQRYEKVWLIMAEDGRKMSKRRGNVVNPDDVIAEYGADAFRTYEMFMGPFDQYISWNTNGLKGVRKFLDKVIALWEKTEEHVVMTKEVETLLHQTIKKTSEDIDAFKFNTTISQFMILVNKLSEQEKINKKLFETLIILLAPFAPHLAEEFREKLGNPFSIFQYAKWPTYEESKLVSDSVKMAVQFNGKVRGTLELSPSASEAEVMELVKQDEKLKEHLSKGEVRKVIYVPWKIINIVL